MGTIPNDPKLARHLGREWSNSIYNLSTTVLKEALETGQTTQEISLKIAVTRSFEINPLYGHRGKVVIESLVRNWNL